MTNAETNTALYQHILTTVNSDSLECLFVFKIHFKVLTHAQQSARTYTGKNEEKKHKFNTNK